MMFKFSRAKGAVAYSLFCLPAIVCPAFSQPKSSQGIIAFSSNQDWNPAFNARDGVTPENVEIYALSPDDKKSVRLTTYLEWDSTPSLSADGSRLFFASSRSGKVELYSMKLSAKLDPPAPGQLQRIVTGDEFASIPVPSWDGRYLAYTSENGGESWLNIITLNDGQKKKVTRLSGSSTFIAFVPDNQRIVFTVGHPNSRGRDLADICIVNLDGTGRKVIGRGFYPSCNPQGTRVVFSTFGPLCTMNLDGSDVRKFTSEGSSGGDPSYSPDGAHIVFTGEPQGRSARGLFAREALNVSEGTAIYIMKADGTEVQRLTYGRGDNTQPTWSVKPDVPYSPPPTPPPTPNPQIQSLTQSPASEPLQKLTEISNKGELLYAFNDLKTAPYSSFIGAQSDGKTQTFRLQGPNLEGTNGDFVFDPQLLQNSSDVLIKLGDPVVRERNPYNSYRLWQWNRQTNALTSAAPRELFFRQVAPAPDGQRLAYLAGGNALGQTPAENGGIGEPLQLFIYEPQTKKETLVSDNVGVRGGFAWLDKNTLLYTAVPAPEKTKLNPRGFARPAIYAFDVASGQSKLLLNEARHPMPSPDGTRIAFWGLRENEEAVPLPDEWWQTTGYAHLSVAERDGSGRKAYGRIIGRYPSLVWASNNQQVFWLRESEASPKAHKAQAAIETWDVVTNTARSIGTLMARDAKETERAWFQPQFRALHVSRDGKTLLNAVEEVAEDGKVVARVLSVDVGSGQTTSVAQLKNASGFDWRATPIKK